AVLGRDQRNLIPFDRLVFRLRELRRARQVDPQLDAVECAAAFHEFGRGRLDVQDAGARGHPLGGAVGDQAATAVRILVGEPAVNHVRDGFEPAVWMPRRASGFTGLIFDLTHLVHVHERVEGRGGYAGECADDGKALALVAPRTGGHSAHRAFGVPGRGCDDAGKSQCFCCYGWHALYNRTEVRLFRGSQRKTSRAAARAAVGPATASTASAASRHCSSVTEASLAPAPATAAAAIDREVMPSPTSTQASSGSAAASPHTPTGLPARSPARAVAATSANTAGCHGS